MGQLVSESDCGGMIVNSVMLGLATFTDEGNESKDCLFMWDDPRIPSGAISDTGEIVVDEMEL